MSLSNAKAADAAAAAKHASHQLATLPAAARNDALTAVHSALAAAKEDILAANARDMEQAQKAAADGSLSSSLVSRLDLSKPGKWEDMLQGILDVRGLEDPVGRVTLRTRIDDGLELERVTCPIGVLLIIFEARPEVIANIAALAIKSGNAAILKGGKESTESFVAIASVIVSALKSTQVPNEAVQLVTTRDAVSDLLSQDRFVDLVIPRGGNDLVRYVKNNTRIPVLGHADGLCSVYIANDADPALVIDVVVDSKTNYLAACNAAETLLVSRGTALTTILPAVASALAAKGVTLRCDSESLAAVQDTVGAAAKEATAEDFDTEFLSLDIAVKTVDGLDAAITHINTHGSHHTDAILTASSKDAERFMAAVDSAGVYWNASTRFADGMRYGFGTEVGISTNKIHSRGPVGLDGLMIYKYKLRGKGQVAGSYGEGEGKRRFIHKTLPL